MSTSEAISALRNLVELTTNPIYTKQEINRSLSVLGDAMGRLDSSPLNEEAMRTIRAISETIGNMRERDDHSTGPPVVLVIDQDQMISGATLEALKKSVDKVSDMIKRPVVVVSDIASIYDVVGSDLEYYDATETLKVLAESFDLKNADSDFTGE